MTAKQHLPESSIGLSDFPGRTVAAGEQMYRAHSVSRSAWWFDDSPHGRFNLHDGRATCCTATTVDTAVREKVREAASMSQVVEKSFAERFTVSVLKAPISYRCAAVSSAPAAAFGIVRELVTMEDYAVPQAWAAAFDAAGFGGVFYGSAYTTGEATALALFAETGTPLASSGYTEAVHMSGPDACASVGMTVMAPPPARGLQLFT